MDAKIKEVDASKEKKIVGVQMPLAVYYRLVDEADKEFMTVSAYLRKLIMQHTGAYRKSSKTKE